MALEEIPKLGRIIVKGPLYREAWLTILLRISDSSNPNLDNNSLYTLANTHFINVSKLEILS